MSGVLRMGRPGLHAWLVLTLFLAGACAEEPVSDGDLGAGSDRTGTAGSGPGTDPTGIGADRALEGTCLGCHVQIADSWRKGSSHAQLMSCVHCHEGDVTRPGPGHMSALSCSDCHSQVTHSGQACTVCHDQHGSGNLYLLRERLPLPEGGEAMIDVTEAVGAGPHGLVRQGVEGQTAGTGLCEVCHSERVARYNRTGKGEPHEAGWCAECHQHGQGFRPGR